MSVFDRIPESAVLARASADLRAGVGRTVCVVGEADSGKSAVLRAAALRLRTAGALVLDGRAAEHERHVPLGVIVDALDPVVARLGRERVAAAGPELGAVLPAAAGREPLDVAGPAERHRHHRAVRTLLELLGRERPIALLLDDLHRADAASIETIESLLRHPPRVPLLMVLTLEPTELAARLAAAGSDRDGWEELALGAGEPATPEPTARCAALDPPPGAPQDGAAGDCDALDPAPRALLDGAAVAGDPFSLDVAAAAAGLGRADAAAALDALLAAGLVRAGARGGMLRFRDDALRRGVTAAIEPDGRASAHERAAYALLAIGARPAAVAHHVERFGRAGDPGAIALLTDAAEASKDTSPAAAAHWYAAALRLLHDDDAATRAALRTAMGRALIAAGRPEEAATALADVRADAPAPALRAVEQDLALARSGDLPEADAPWAEGARRGSAERYAEAVGALERGLRAARAERADHLLLPFHTLIARFALPLLDLDAALEHAEAAEAIARLRGPTRALAAALSDGAQVLAVRGEPAEARRAAAESDQLLADLPADAATRTARAHNIVVRCAADPARLLAELTAVAGPRLEELDTSAVAGLLLMATRAALALGRVDEAGGYVALTIRIADGPSRPASHVRGVRARAEVLLARGDARAAARLAASAVSDAERLGLRQEDLGARLLSGRALVAAGQREAGLAELRRTAEGAARLGAVAQRDAATDALHGASALAPTHARRAGGPAALSERERSVAELVAAGRSNKDVAATLFLSEKTVEANLTRIYDKLGVRSRTELAAAWR